MKKTAKILSLMLVFSLCFGIVPASAADYTPPTTYIYGDVDFDGAVTVKDATEIQKGVADIVYLIGVQKYLADPDAQGVSVKNATEIQKYVAAIGLGSNRLGTDINMSLYNKFSSAVPQDADFENNMIIVSPKKEFENYTYTTEDFPEYEFESIYRLSSDILFLYLKNPTRENVLEAIKALDYRANLDLSGAEPNYLAYID